MPKGYVIFLETIRDPAGMAAYGQKAGPAMAGSGVRVLVVDDDPEVIEGTWPRTRTVILEFESVEAAKNWYRSPEYQAAIPLRQAASDADAVIVAGFEPPGR